MCFCFCLCLVCFESRRQLLRLEEVWDSLVLNQLRVFTGSLKEDLVFRRRFFFLLHSRTSDQALSVIEV